MGSGVRVPLRFAPNFKVRGGPKGQANVSLFLGAIVALKGRNGGGGWFSVNEVLSVRLFISSIRIDVSYMFSCLACSRLSRIVKGRSMSPEKRRSRWQ